jgi:hypothetical protein
LLRELNPVKNGWGLYAFRLEPKNELIIEAPHPLADENTPLIALKIYRQLNARALLVAGTHRASNPNDEADVAHIPDSIFQTIHLSLLGPQSVVLQIHGFSSDKHINYPQIVIGQNQYANSEILQDLNESLVKENITVGLCDGVNWTDLCGETNVQSTTMENGTFIHFEINEKLRNDPGILIEIIKKVFKAHGYL